MTTTVPLRRLVDVIDCAHVTAKFVDDDRRFPVASIRECQGSHVDLANCNYTTQDFFQHLRAGGRAPHVGDLLFVRNVSVGLVSAVAPGTPEFAVGQETVLLRRTSNVDPTFLRYALVGAQAAHAIESAMIGTTFRRINVSGIRSLPVALPDLEEQRTIAAYLDRETARIDTLIEDQRRLIDLLRERRISVLRNCILEAGHAKSTDKLGRWTVIGNGSTPRRDNVSYWSDEGIPWLNSAVVNRDVVDTADQFVTATARSECHLPLVSAGSVLVGLTGQGRTRGMATLLTMEATVNQHLAYVSPDHEAWDSRFLLWSLRASYDELRAFSDENGSTKGGLTCADLKAFRVARPTVEEQRRVATHLDQQTSKIDSLVAEAERFIELAKERRSALITAAVTGQIDVRAAESGVAS